MSDEAKPLSAKEIEQHRAILLHDCYGSGSMCATKGRAPDHYLRRRMLATIADLQARTLDEDAIERIAIDVAARVNGTVSINWRNLEDGGDVLADFASDVRDGIRDEIAKRKAEA